MKNVKKLSPVEAANALRELSRKHGGSTIHHAIDSMIGWVERGNDQTHKIRGYRKALAEAMQILRQTDFNHAEVKRVEKLDYQEDDYEDEEKEDDDYEDEEDDYEEDEEEDEDFNFPL